jgi:ribosomal protein S18 acetylase RimI-like enzyme
MGRSERSQRPRGGPLAVRRTEEPPLAAGSGVAVRRATQHDAAAVADVWLRSFGTALPTVRRAHTDDEVRAWIRDVVVPHRETWVATVDGAVAAMMVLDPASAELDQLYVDPPYQHSGLGTRLLGVAQQQRPSRLALWTLQINTAAREFYERHGFVAIELTDGRDNEEHEPDVRYEWRP